MIVRFKKLYPEAVVPQKAHPSDAAFDLTAAHRWFEEDNIVYGTGIAVEIPAGYVGLVFPRSSIARKRLVLSNGVGVIDSGYRGEILFKFKSTLANSPASRTNYNYTYEEGERIGQLIVLPYPDIEFVEAEELSDSDRGTGGYGSTGK